MRSFSKSHLLHVRRPFLDLAIPTEQITGVSSPTAFGAPLSNVRTLTFGETPSCQDHPFAYDTSGAPVEVSNEIEGKERTNEAESRFLSTGLRARHDCPCDASAPHWLRARHWCHCRLGERHDLLDAARGNGRRCVRAHWLWQWQHHLDRRLRLRSVHPQLSLVRCHHLVIHVNNCRLPCYHVHLRTERTIDRFALDKHHDDGGGPGRR